MGTFRFNLKVKSLIIFRIVVALAFSSNGSFAYADAILPQGEEVVHGNASFDRNTPNTLNVNQNTDALIANWQSFSIGSNGTVNFYQPSSSSVALNRVVSMQPSEIFGALNANGNIFLINPNGVLFAPGSSVNVGGLVASTLNISNEDFLGGNYSFYQDPSFDPSYVINQGIITAAEGGDVSLMGGAVSNEGVITAPLGSINLVSGEAITLQLDDRGLIYADVNGAIEEEVFDNNGEKINDAVLNAGTLQANGGRVTMKAEAVSDVFSKLVNQTGIIRAQSLVERDGVIMLTSASPGIVQNTGTIDASGLEQGADGGSITMEGERVGQFGEVHADAIDGDGGNIDIYASEVVSLSSNSLTTANAGLNGDGGEVIVFSPDTALFWPDAKIEARGGNQSGNGGFVEVSGRKHVEVYGLADMTAPNGEAGTFLIDPYNVIINNLNNDPGAWDPTNTYYTPTHNNSRIRDTTLESNLTLGNVVITTDGVGGQDGDITVDRSIEYNGANSLTLQAANDININDDINMNSAGGGSGNLTLHADWGGGDEPSDGVGAIVNGGGTLVMGSGDLLMIAGNGIGSLGNPIQTVGLTDIAAITQTNHIVINNSTSGNINVTTVDTTDGLSTSIGDIVVNNTGRNITVSQPIQSVASGDVSLNGAVIDIDANINSHRDININGTGALDVAAGSRIIGTSLGSSINIVAAGVTLNAGSAGTETVTTNAGSTIITSTGPGDISLSNNSVRVDSGVITVVSGGAINGSDDTTVDVSGPTINLTASSGGIGTTSIVDVAVTDALNADTTADNSDISIDGIGDLYVDQVNAGSGTVTLASDSAIIGDSSVLVVGDTIDLTAPGGISSVDIDLGTTGNLYLDTSAGAGDINITETGGELKTSDIFVETAASSTQTVTISNSGGNIVVDNHTWDDNIGDDFIILSGGLSNNVEIRNTGSVTTTNDVLLSGSSIVGNDANQADVTADGVMLGALNDIGSAADPIQTDVTNLLGVLTIDGDVYLDEIDTTSTNGLTITGDVDSGGSDYTQTVAGNININAPISCGTTGNVTITSIAGTNGSITSNSSGTIDAGTTSGWMALSADEGIDLGANATTYGGSGTGGITINADTDADANGTFEVQDGVTVTAGGANNNITVRAWDLDLNTTGALSAAGDSVNMYASSAVRPFFVGAAGAGFNISTAEMENITASTLVVGQPGTQTGTITIDNVNSASIAPNLEFYSNGSGGAVTFANNAYNVTSGAGLQVTADDINVGVNITNDDTIEFIATDGGDLDFTSAVTVLATSGNVDFDTIDGTIDLEVAGGTVTIDSTNGTVALDTVDDSGNDTSLTVNSGGDATLANVGAGGAINDLDVDAGDAGNVTFGSIDSVGAVSVTNANQVNWNGAVGATSAPTSISATAANVNTGMQINANLTSSGPITLGTTAGDIDIVGARTITSTNGAVDMSSVGGTIDLQAVGVANFTVSSGTGTTLATVDDAAHINGLRVYAGNTGAGNVQIGNIGSTHAIGSTVVDVNGNGTVTFGTIDDTGGIDITNATGISFNGNIGDTAAPSNLNANTGITGNVSFGAATSNVDFQAGIIIENGANDVTIANPNLNITSGLVQIGTTGGALQLNGGVGTVVIEAITNVRLGAIDDPGSNSNLRVNVTGTTPGTATISGAIGSTNALDGLAIQANDIAGAGFTNTSNDVNTIAANITGLNNPFSFTDANSVTVGTVSGISGITTNNGAVTVTADDMNILQAINSGTGITTLDTTNAGRPIDLGTNTGGTLGLTSAELDLVTAGVLRVGNASSGSILVSSAIAPANTNTLSLINNGTVSQNAGATITESNLRISSDGAVTLTENNDAGTIAANVTGLGNAFSFTDVNDLIVGTVDTVSGITTNGGNVTLDVGGSLTLNQPINGGNDIILISNNPMTINSNLNATGTVSITSRADDTGAIPLPFTLTGGNTITSGGNTTIQADDMDLSGSINAGANTVLLRSNTDGDPIEIGGDSTTPNELELSSAELDNVTAGILRIGHNNAGNISVTQAINPANTNTLSLITGGGVTQTAGSTIEETNLRISSVGAVNLMEGNNVDTLAAAVTGAGNAFNFRDINTLATGTVDGVSGVTTGSPTVIGGEIILQVDTGGLTIGAGAPVMSYGGDIRLRVGGGGAIVFNDVVDSRTVPSSVNDGDIYIENVAAGATIGVGYGLGAGEVDVTGAAIATQLDPTTISGNVLAGQGMVWLGSSTAGDVYVGVADFTGQNVGIITGANIFGYTAPPPWSPVPPVQHLLAADRLGLDASANGYIGVIPLGVLPGPNNPQIVYPLNIQADELQATAMFDININESDDLILSHRTSNVAVTSLMGDVTITTGTQTNYIPVPPPQLSGNLVVQQGISAVNGDVYLNVPLATSGVPGNITDPLDINTRITTNSLYIVCQGSVGIDTMAGRLDTQVDYLANSTIFGPTYILEFDDINLHDSIVTDNRFDLIAMGSIFQSGSVMRSYATTRLLAYGTIGAPYRPVWVYDRNYGTHVAAYGMRDEVSINMRGTILPNDRPVSPSDRPLIDNVPPGLVLFNYRLFGGGNIGNIKNRGYVAVNAESNRLSSLSYNSFLNNWNYNGNLNRSLLDASELIDNQTVYGAPLLVDVEGLGYELALDQNQNEVILLGPNTPLGYRVYLPHNVIYVPYYFLSPLPF